MKKLLITFLTALCFVGNCGLFISSDISAEIKEEQNLHVPSPDWRDQIVYFLMTDRFSDGDTKNNDQGHNVYRPSQNNYFNGGDLQGVINKIDYIKSLGATAVWITPPVANLWWSPKASLAGYHGYWARDFKAVDKHLGTLETYQLLSHQLHENNMYLIQDIVTNHVGEYFTYQGKYDADNTSKNFTFIKDIQPTAAPTQYPFNLIDRNNPEHYTAQIYHWTPEIIDYSNELQESNYQTAGLNDLNTTNPVVIDALKDSFGYWIKEVGVDAFRLDTAKYVEHEFLNEFIHGDKGIIETAKNTGRTSFPIFGEVFETSPAMSDKGEQKIASFQGSESKPELNAAIGFPLYEEINRVFAQGRPTSNLTYRLNKQMETYKDPYLIANFVDNHDVPRFLAKGDLLGFKQALALIMTVPGIPVIYQGDEQAFEESRQAMFKGGYLTKEDQFNTNSDMFKYIQKLATIRTNNKLFSRGDIKIIKDNDSGPGVFAYQRSYNDKTAFVIYNTANYTTLLSNLNTGLKEQQINSFLLSENFSDSLIIQSNGKTSIELPARSVIIFTVGKEDFLSDNQNTESDNKLADITINPPSNGWTINKTTIISGSILGAKLQSSSTLKLIIDGNLDMATNIDVDAVIDGISDGKGQWKSSLVVDGLGTKLHSFEIYSKELNIVSKKINYITNVTNAEIERSYHDPLADDKGFSGQYIKPKTTGFDGQMDIRKVTVKSAGKNLLLSITMDELKSYWVAANGFDHVMFNIYFDLPNSEGLDDLPLLQTKSPKDFKWDIEHVLFGWGSKLYSSEGASKNSRGKGLAHSPSLSINKKTNTIDILYEGASLDIASWQGAKVYVTTWDGDGEGNRRPLSKDGGFWEFGGATSNSPLVLDDIKPVIISNKPFTNNAMAPLDMKNNKKQWDDFKHQLSIAKKMGIDAISVDVWWSAVEGEADNQFDWQYYDKILSVIESEDLHWVPIMSFHRCGGYANDVCNAPIPNWFWNHYEDQGISKEELQYKGENDVFNDESVSLWQDEVAIKQYIEFMEAFQEHYSSKADIIDELNVSMGASGELRYPAYSPAGSICDYPSRGCFQAYSELAKKDFIAFAKNKYETLELLNRAWGTSLSSFADISPPDDGTPEDGRASQFVTSGNYINTQYGKDFIDWYNNALVEHGRRMTAAGIKAFSGAFANIEIGLKIAGIHWQMAPNAPYPRITEMAVGFIQSSLDVNNRSTGYGYQNLLDMVASFKDKHVVTLHFTNLEGDDIEIVDNRKVYSQARTQLNYIAEAANDVGVRLKGENAMAPGVESEHGWDNINRSVNEHTFHGLTVLRVDSVTDNIIGQKRFKQFIKDSKESH